jgi:arylsulfatase A-like enzyme
MRLERLRLWLCLVAFAAASIPGIAPYLVAAATSPPNIVLIMVDDLGAEWNSSYGADDIETPEIDKLAAGGMRFTNAYSMPQCTPTRATLLTGQYPFRHGWTNHWDVPRWGAGVHFDPKHNISFARPIKKAGYVTAIAGKWQINDFRLQPNVLREHGFDEWSMWTGFESQNPPSAERYWDPYVYTSKAKSKTYEGKFGPDIYNEFLVDFVSRHHGQPMLIYYPMALTHTPLVATPLEPNAASDIEKHRAMVRYTDLLVGRLVRAIDDAGVRDNTIIFFTTDNGTAQSISGHLNGREVQGGKARLTENGTRQPFIVNGPGLVPAGVVTDALTDFTDLFPTFCELAGAELPSGLTIDGRSIAGLILGRDNDGPRDWMLSMGFGPARLDAQGVRPAQEFTDRVIRGKQYKLHIIDSRPSELYDLSADPREEHNLIASTKPEDVAARKKLAAVMVKFPNHDARPRYDPLPPQPWDMTRERNAEMLGQREESR